MKKKLISILIPFFNEKGALKPLVYELKEIEKLITDPLEQEIKGVIGLIEIESTSSEGIRSLILSWMSSSSISPST